MERINDLPQRSHTTSIFVVTTIKLDTFSFSSPGGSIITCCDAYSAKYGSLAQWREQLPFKQSGWSSSLQRPTKILFGAMRVS